MQCSAEKMKSSAHSSEILKDKNKNNFVKNEVVLCFVVGAKTDWFSKIIYHFIILVNI